MTLPCGQERERRDAPEIERRPGLLGQAVPARGDDVAGGDPSTPEELSGEFGRGYAGHGRGMRFVQWRVTPSVVAVTVVAVAAVITGCVMLIPQVRFGYRSVGGHVAVETAAVLIALLVALLALGRFRRGGAVVDLLLTATFMLLALVNLVFSTVPAVVSDLPNDAATWGALGGRVIGAGLLAAGAVSYTHLTLPTILLV